MKKNTSSALEIQVLKSNKKHMFALISRDGDVSMLGKLPFVTSLKKYAEVYKNVLLGRRISSP